MKDSGKLNCWCMSTMNVHVHISFKWNMGGFSVIRVYTCFGWCGVIKRSILDVLNSCCINNLLSMCIKIGFMTIFSCQHIIHVVCQSNTLYKVFFLSFLLSAFFI